MNKFHNISLFILVITLLLPIFVSGQTCNDSDGGYNISIKGSIVGPKFASGETATDYCFNYGTYGLQEYYCSGSGEIASKPVDCLCADGACVTPSPCSCPGLESVAKSFEKASIVFRGEVKILTETNDSESAFFTISRTWKGKWESRNSASVSTPKFSCGLEFKVGEEYVVYANKMEIDKSGDDNYTATLCGRTQLLSRVIESELRELDELGGYCLDSDRGDDIFKKGTIKGVKLSNGEYPADYCSENFFLVEYSCSGPKTFSSKSVNCENSCEDGACRKEPPPEGLPPKRGPFPTPFNNCPAGVNFSTVASQISKYNHCVFNHDCVVVRGGICGFHSGTVVNRNDADEATAIINSCRQDGCYEDGPGYALRVGCVENKCRYLRPGEISIWGKLISTRKMSNSSVIKWFFSPVKWIIEPIADKNI